MKSFVKLYSDKKGEISKFLNEFYSSSNISKNISLNALEWENIYENPVEISDIIGVFIENNDKYKINMWVSLDKDILFNVTEHNADDIIKYLYERYPY